MRIEDVNIAPTGLELFEKLVKDHDLTYSYSDDAGSWRRGQEQYDAIAAAARDLPREDVVRIWNAQVDRKIAEAYRAQFYWRGL